MKPKQNQKLRWEIITMCQRGLRCHKKHFKGILQNIFIQCYTLQLYIFCGVCLFKKEARGKETRHFITNPAVFFCCKEFWRVKLPWHQFSQSVCHTSFSLLTTFWQCHTSVVSFKRKKKKRQKFPIYFIKQSSKLTSSGFCIWNLWVCRYLTICTENLRD